MLEPNSKYKLQSYWDERFLEEEEFDWFSQYSSFSSILKRHISPECRILNLGCGNSRLSADLYLDGFEHITNIDYSPVVIEKMKNKFKQFSKMRWLVQDIRWMEFEDCSFDVVIEKGTLDALLVDERDPWNLSPDGAKMVDLVCQQVTRLLKPGGRFLSITFSAPHFRKLLFMRDEYAWSVEHATFHVGFEYFIYITIKGEQLTAENRTFLADWKKRKEINFEQVMFNSMQEDEDENFIFHIHIDDE